MLRVSHLRLGLDEQEQALLPQAARALRTTPAAIAACQIAKISVDARNQRDVHFVVSADVAVRGRAVRADRKSHQV